VNEKSLTNEQVVVLAVARLGGDSSLIDTEDVAVQADQIAPQRFRWRKYPQYINNELVHTALRDAKRLGGLLRGSGSSGWQLTSGGMSLVHELGEKGLSGAEPRRRLDPKEKAWLARERVRLLSEDAFHKFREVGIAGVTRQEAERFFRLDDYVVGGVRQARLQRFLNLFSDDPDLGVAVVALVKIAGNSGDT